MHLIQVFVFLQLLDVLTTVLGLKLGAQELNPVIRQFMEAGPLVGLAISKAAVLVLGGVVIWMQRQRVLVTVNYLFGVLIVWNLSQLLLIPARVV